MEEQRLSSQMLWRIRGCPHRCNGGAEAVLTDIMEEQRLSSQM
jgi:hypothetical protein